MSMLKTLTISACCALILCSPADAHVKFMRPLQEAAGADTTEADEKFDSFLEQLITRMQAMAEDAVNKKESKEPSFEEEFEESSDSTDVITGDFLVAHDEVVDRDLFIKDGSLTVEGLLRGNATVLRGDIVVRSGGRITGNAHAINGSVTRELNGTVEGDIRETTSRRPTLWGQYLKRHSAYTFAPKWLHENLEAEGPVFRYNRVEGVYLGVSSAKKFYWDGKRIISGYGSAGYGFLTHRWRGQLGLDRQFAGSAGIVEFGGEGHNLTDTKDEWIMNSTENTIAAFLFRNDYRDYFQRAGFSAHTAWYTKSSGLSTMINAEYRYDEYQSLYRNTNWSLFKNKDGFRENPSVNEGLMRSIAVTAGLSTVGRYRYASVGWNTYAQAEFGGRGLGGDFSFTRAVVDVRRFQPLSKFDNLNMRVRFGSLEGDALVQKAFELGGANTLPGFGYKEFAGNRMMLGNIEYALNGSVFDDVSFWPGFMTMMIFADAGATQTVDTKTKVTDGFNGFSIRSLKSDIGFALGWHDGTAKLGFAWRTDKSAPPIVFIRLSRPF